MAEKPSRRRRLAKVLVALVVVAAIVAAGIIGAKQVYFLGTDDGGRLTLYRGLPYDLPFGVELYSKQYSVPIQAASVPPGRRDSVTNHELRSKDDAVSLLGDLQSAAEQVTAEEAAQQSSSSSPTGSQDTGSAANDSAGASSSGSGNASGGSSGSGTGGKGDAKAGNGGSNGSG